MKPQSRRTFIKSLSAYLTSLWCCQNLNASGASFSLGVPKAKAVILLWMGGGMAHTETFDPKEYRDFEIGMRPQDVACTFPSIPTVVDGINISSGLEEIAKIMDRGMILRSVLPGSLGTVLHSRYQYLWHTGYAPPLTVAAPHIGAWLSRFLGPRTKGVRPFVEIGQGFNHMEGNELRSFLSSGFLGPKHSPISIPNPILAPTMLRPKAGEARRQFVDRLNLYKHLTQRGVLSRDLDTGYIEELRDTFDDTKMMLESPLASALDYTEERQGIRDKYGEGKFATGCLLARRLIEAGVRFVEVSSDYRPFDSWDTHYDGHRRTKKLKEMIDKPIARLVLELEERSLLDETLVIVASEFSRDSTVEGSVRAPTSPTEEQPQVITDIKHWGLHRHFTGASSVVIFGGGIKNATVYGKTADRRPCSVVESPVELIDLHATIYSMLGVPPHANIEVDGRPFYVTKDGKGRPNHELVKDPQFNSPSNA